MRWLFCTGEDDVERFSFEDELQEIRYQTEQTAEDLKSHRSTLQYPKPARAAKMLKALKYIAKILYVPACALGLWFGLFTVVVVLGALHWLIGLLTSLSLAVAVYWPATKKVWRALGAQLLQVVRSEVEAEQAADKRVEQHLHRKNAKIGQVRY
eukprot:COSAG01_NODE_286_length_19421_cov_123.895663_14_plen_154_part_00